MNQTEIKKILLVYRPGSADAEDPQIAEALALARQDPELNRWLDDHCAQQALIRARLRQISIPAGLKEQIISEHTILAKPFFRRPVTLRLVAVATTCCILGLIAFLALSDRHSGDALALYKNQMVGVALRGYGMALETNSPAQIRAFLAHSSAPADYILPASLEKVAVTGCGIEAWQNSKVTMICFRTGKPLAPDAKGDLWLFVMDRDLLKDASVGEVPQFSKVNRLITATWTRGNRLYLLGTEGDKQTLQQYL